MSTDMELSQAERTFLSVHLHYDYGVVLGYLALMLAFTLGEEPSSQRLRHHLDELDALEGSARRHCSAPLTGIATRPFKWSTSSNGLKSGQAQHLQR